MRFLVFSMARDAALGGGVGGESLISNVASAIDAKSKTAINNAFLCSFYVADFSDLSTYAVGVTVNQNGRHSLIPAIGAIYAKLAVGRVRLAKQLVANFLA